jgi:hypothetical protein
VELAHLHVRFRFHKNPQNFTIHKFRLISHDFLCPILASNAIVYSSSRPRRSATWHPNPSNPFFPYLTSTNGIRTIGVVG